MHVFTSVTSLTNLATPAISSRSFDGLGVDEQTSGNAQRNRPASPKLRTRDAGADVHPDQVRAFDDGG